MQVVVLGAGPAGLQAASQALILGHEVTILDPEGLGGNGLRHSLLPSKTLIRAADVYEAAGQWMEEPRETEWTRLMAWQRQRVDDGSRRATKEVEGARVLREAGRFEDPHTVVTVQTGTRITADVVIIATGSRQIPIAGLRPDGDRVLLPRVFHEMARLPQEIAILGAGATGLEAASLFSRFGVLIHLYTSAATLLPARSREMSERLAASLQKDGVQLHFDRRVASLAYDGTSGVRIRWTSSLGSGEDVRPRVLIAAGRGPVFERGELESLGFELDGKGFFRVDANGQTSVPGVYAVGDAAGEPLLANKAWSQGWRAVRHALGQGPAPMPGATVHAIYCRPEMAWVGDQSGNRFGGALSAPWLYQPLLEQGPPPYLFLYTDESGRLVGGEAMGGGASETMSTLALAIQAGLTLESLRAFQPASPTSAEWLAEVSRRIPPAP